MVDHECSKKFVKVSEPEELKIEKGPTIIKVNNSRIKKNAETLKKLRHAFSDLNQFTAFFDCRVKCVYNEAHMFKPVKWSDLDKDNISSKYCYQCGYTRASGGLGFYECNVDEYFRICCECLMETNHPSDIEEAKKFNKTQQKIVLCKDYLTQTTEKTKKWICHSVYQKGNQDIPEDWAVCESGLNESVT